jgi:hypothetical protein
MRIGGPPRRAARVDFHSATAVGAAAFAFERARLPEVFVHDPPDTLVLARGELRVDFAHDLPETLALVRGEVGEVFARRSKCGASRRTQRRAAYGDRCCRQTNRYLTS